MEGVWEGVESVQEAMCWLQREKSGLFENSSMSHKDIVTRETTYLF